jgi:hypothetical protein
MAKPKRAVTPQLVLKDSCQVERSSIKAQSLEEQVIELEIRKQTKELEKLRSVSLEKIQCA